MKRIKSMPLFLVVLLICTSTLSATPVTGALSAKAVDEESYIKSKFEPGLWAKVQALKSNGTMTDLSLIIRLVRNPIITGMPIEDLKDYAEILFTENHNATVYSVCAALPVIMANVPVTETERVAAYEFVESIGDGNAKVFVSMNVSRPAIRADDVEHALGYNGSGMKIAILDTGINSSHPDLNDLDDKPATNDPKVILEVSKVDWDNDNVPDVDAMDYVGHGTHVAGIAAGTGKASDYKYKGIAPGAWLMNIKVLKLDWTPGGEPYPEGYQDDCVNGIDDAISEEADIICLALGWAGGDGTSQVAKAADDAVDAGVVVVAAAGNDGQYGSGTIKTPGDAFYVITVGAVDDNDTIGIDDDVLWFRSSRGPTSDGRPKPDVVASGVNIVAPMHKNAEYWKYYSACQVDDFYFSGSGTSMAASEVAGVAALMLQAHPYWKGSPHVVKSVLKRTARLNNNLTQLTENDRGTGIVDALQATAQSNFEIPVAPADSHYTSGWGENYHAEANEEDASYKLVVGTTLMNGSDSYAIATLKKNFVPNHNITNPTFYFSFHDEGILDAQASYAYTDLNALLRLWHNGNSLSQYTPTIHQAMDAFYSTDCLHEISWTYYGELLEGTTYTIEYGFTAYEHEAWANFNPGIRALCLILTHNADLTVRTYDIYGYEKFNVDVWIDSIQYSSPVEDLGVACGDHIVKAKSSFRCIGIKYTFQY